MSDAADDPRGRARQAGRRPVADIGDRAAPACDSGGGIIRLLRAGGPVMRLRRKASLNNHWDTRMFSHVMVGTNDIERSKRFYDAVLGVLGAPEPFRNLNATGQVRLFYRHDGGSFCVSEPIDGESATCANGGTIGFKCSSPAQVQEFHDVAVAHGGSSIEQPPGLREGALGAMYLAYVRDPDGNKLCALHRPKAA